MVSARAKSYQVMLVPDVLLISVVQWVVVRDVILDAAILLIRWTIDRQQLLRGLEDGSLAPNQYTCFSWSRPSFAERRLTIRVESVLDLFQQGLSWHELVRTQSPGVASSDMFPIIFVKPLLQNTQHVLLLKQKSVLQVAKAAVYGKGVAAVFERGEVGIPDFEVTHCC